MNAQTRTYTVYFYDYNHNTSKETLSATEIYERLADGMGIESFTIDGFAEWEDMKTNTLDADQLQDWVIAHS